MSQQATDTPTTSDDPTNGGADSPPSDDPTNGGADSLPTGAPPKPSPPPPSEPGPRAVRFAHVTLGVAIALSLSQVAFALQLHRPTLLVVLPLLIGALLATAYKLRPAHKLTAALVVLPAIVLVYGFEWRIARARPYDGSAAERRGVTFDSRSSWETIREKRAQGQEAYPSLQPRALLVLNLQQGTSPTEIQNHLLSPEWGVEVDGERVLPLGGIANKPIVYCNEGGKFVEYDSDELGFNNPRGIWGKDTLDVGLVGDSFTQAACVGQDENTAHWVRQKYPATLSLGMAGNGPLIELAGLGELLAPKKPKIVLWVYYNNDLADLDVEKQSPLLRRYLEEDGFSQKLALKQAKIDAALMALAERIDARAPAWPSALGAVGLTRSRSPMWLGDIAMRESHSATTAVLRLDRLSFGITSLAVADFLNAPPDFPLFKQVLAKAKSRVESWGGKLHFVYMADMFYLQYKGKREQHNRQGVLATVKELGIPLIDAHPTFLALGDSTTIRFHPESHCNAAGYKLLSEVVLKALDGDGKGADGK